MTLHKFQDSIRIRHAPTNQSYPYSLTEARACFAEVADATLSCFVSLLLHIKFQVQLIKFLCQKCRHKQLNDELNDI